MLGLVIRFTLGVLRAHGWTFLFHFLRINSSGFLVNEPSPPIYCSAPQVNNTMPVLNKSIYDNGIKSKHSVFSAYPRSFTNSVTSVPHWKHYFSKSEPPIINFRYSCYHYIRLVDFSRMTWLPYGSKGGMSSMVTVSIKILSCEGGMFLKNVIWHWLSIDSLYSW